MHEIVKNLRRSRLIRGVDLWAVGLPVTVITVLLALILAKALTHFFGHAPDFSQVLSTFRGGLTPKPEQQLRYILILALWPTLFLIALFLIKAKNFRISSQLINASQIALIVFLLFNVAYQEAFVHAYFATKSPTMAYSVLAFFAAVYTAYRVLFPQRGEASRWRISARTAVGIAVVVSILELLVCIITDQNYLGTAPGVLSHLPFTFDEFAAVANGHTLSVDYFPQYQQLLPYLFSPIFHLFGLSITTYTILLASLSGITIGFIYAILIRICVRREVALLLFLSWLGIAFFPIETNGPARYLAFTYFPIGPFRLFGFWSVAYFTIRAVAGHFTFRKQALCFFWASLVAFNTFDFGIPGLIGCLIVMLLFSEKWKNTALAFLAGFSGSLLVYLAIPLIRAGTLPNLGVAFSYLLAVGRVGYTALHTPTWGDHWIFLLALLGALAVGTLEWWNNRILPEMDIRRKSLTAIYIFTGIAGSGAFAYFMNRSHWHVLAVVAPIAFFPFLLFTITLFDRERQSRFLPQLNRVPRTVCFIIVACGLGLLKNTPNPVTQWERLTSTDPSFYDRESAYVARVSDFSKPGEKVAISYPFSQLIASRAKVVNIFPYPQAISMVLRSQFDIATGVMEKNEIKTLFGDFPVEFTPWMEKNGFKIVDRLSDFSVYRRLSGSVQ